MNETSKDPQYYFPQKKNFIGALYNIDNYSGAVPYSQALGTALRDPAITNLEDSVSDTISDSDCIQNAINGLTARGTTFPNIGFKMAEDILNARTTTQYTDKNGERHNRNVVVVLFTDGAPGGTNGYSEGDAGNAVSEAHTLKSAYGAALFTVGVFGTDTNASDLKDIDAFMNAASSNYPDATDLTDIGTKAADTYYVTASDASGLSSAFESVATSVDSSSTTVTVGVDSVLKDTVNVSDFDVTGATYAAYTQSAMRTGNSVTGSGELIALTVDGAAVAGKVPASGEIAVSGYDYKNRYLTDRSTGEWLVVQITGLKPKASGTINSNIGDAGIYVNDEATEPVVSAGSPTVKVTPETKLVDFSAQAVLATDVLNSNIVTENGGTFSTTGNLTFTPRFAASDNTWDVSAFSTVSTALYCKASGTEKPWTLVNVVPASSVYYDDDLLKTPMTMDGSGYNAAVSASTETSNLDASAQYTFTFYGTGIDIYCTTNKDGGNIVAKLDGDPSKVTIMRNYSNTERYNVPTISYTGLTQGEHTVLLQTLSNTNYKLDGVRVYNAVNDETLYNGTDEQYASYVNLRKALVNAAANDFTVYSDDMKQDAFGALFVDDASKLKTEDDKVVFSSYQENSPKNEIYLAGKTDEKDGQMVVFGLKESVYNADHAKIWVGLSAPDQGANGGTVKINGTPVNVTSAVDMYYSVTPGDGGVVKIENTGSSMISVTNLKITGVELGGESTDNAQAFSQLTFQSLKIAANDGVDPDTVVVPDEPVTTEEPETPKSGWSDSARTPASILKNAFKLLLQSLSGLFSGLLPW